MVWGDWPGSMFVVGDWVLLGLLEIWKAFVSWLGCYFVSRFWCCNDGGMTVVVVRMNGFQACDVGCCCCCC